MYLLKSISIILASLFIFCIPSPPIVPVKPGAPQFDSIELSVRVDKRFDQYSESIHLKWSPPSTDSSTISKYTLLRKFPGDSSFDIFQLSNNIPSSVEEFYDQLKYEHFPTDGYDSLFYKIYAIDDFGRIGDTSEACTLVIAPQPTIDTLITTTNYVAWESWIRGSQSSKAWFWNDSITNKWVFRSPDLFPRTDEPARFIVHIPDSSMLLKDKRLNFALFLYIADMQSILVGYVDTK